MMPLVKRYDHGVQGTPSMQDVDEAGSIEELMAVLSHLPPEGA